MKYLSNYMEDQQTEAFKVNGAFFAFSSKQFDEQKADGVKYVSVGAGLIAPKENVTQLIDQLDTIHQTAMQQDIAENGVKAIIHRELANHECQITMDYSDAFAVLEPYGITEEQVKAEWGEFWQTCVDNDYF